MLISQIELEKALEAFSNVTMSIDGEFVYRSVDTSGREFFITRERVAALALHRFKEIRKTLGMLHETK